MIIVLCLIFCGFFLGIICYFANKYRSECNALAAQLKDIQERLAASISALLINVKLFWGKFFGFE
ncbi:MAG: hypothetical protein LBR92_03110 [Puniceicoccales bacterium]|jgi:hypothetical protein|nr:hypothetical protein [Puniceicoccales bacterium]